LKKKKKTETTPMGKWKELEVRPHDYPGGRIMKKKAMSDKGQEEPVPKKRSGRPLAKN